MTTWIDRQINPIPSNEKTLDKRNLRQHRSRYINTPMTLIQYKCTRLYRSTFIIIYWYDINTTSEERYQYISRYTNTPMILQLKCIRLHRIQFTLMMIKAWKCNFPPFKELMTGQPTDKQTNMRAHMEATLPIEDIDLLFPSLRMHFNNCMILPELAKGAV